MASRQQTPKEATVSEMSRSAHRIAWVIRRVASSMRPRLLKRTFAIHRAIDTRGLRSREPATRRLLNAVVSIVRDPAPTGEIWAVTMVKNEADIIEETLRSMVSQGVDQIIVADNGSSDETPAILDRLTADLPLHVLSDPIVAYWQSDKMSMLARLATSMGAAWIVPFDADEHWYGTGDRTLAEVLRSADAEVVRAKWFLYLPVKETGAQAFAERFPYRLREPSEAVKVAFRANWLARLRTGNHGVTVPGNRTIDGLRIAHYSLRTPEQVLRKSRDGAAAARASGEELHVARWFDLENADEDAGRRAIADLGQASETVFDPASSWTSSSSGSSNGPNPS